MEFHIRKKESTFWYLERLLSLAGFFYCTTYLLVLDLFINKFKYTKILMNWSLRGGIIFAGFLVYFYLVEKISNKK